MDITDIINKVKAVWSQIMGSALNGIPFPKIWVPILIILIVVFIFMSVGELLIPIILVAVVGFIGYYLIKH